MKGIALKIRNKNNCTAADIINTHYKKEKETGAVYYSTDISIGIDRNIEQVLFYFIHQGNTRFVVADIISLETNKEPFITEKSELYSPAQYATEAKLSWLLIKNMKEVPVDFADGCEVSYKNGDIKNLLDVIQQPRINRVYYSVCDVDDEDILIK